MTLTVRQMTIIHSMYAPGFHKESGLIRAWHIGILMAEGRILDDTEETLDTIMGILKDEGMVDVKTLSQRLEVTEKTVRLDLKELENQNLVERVHGGAVLKSRQCH